MKKLLGILLLSLLWSNVGIAAEREPGTDKKCFYQFEKAKVFERKFLPKVNNCLLYTSPSPRDATLSRMASSA